ncbi:Unknown protein, partial [Striga hermonthica]
VDDGSGSGVKKVVVEVTVARKSKVVIPSSLPQKTLGPKNKKRGSDEVDPKQMADSSKRLKIQDKGKSIEAPRSPGALETVTLERPSRLWDHPHSHEIAKYLDYVIPAADKARADRDPYDRAGPGREQPGTMSGMLSLLDVPVFALVDTGATHSFVSAKCLEAIGVQGVSDVDPLEISLASARKIVTSSLAKNLSMCIGGRTLEVDAFVIEMRDFDLILGMDWLERYHTDIRCRDREVTLHLADGDHITFFGMRTRTLPRIISMAKATKCLRRDD